MNADLSRFECGWNASPAVRGKTACTASIAAAECAYARNPAFTAINLAAACVENFLMRVNVNGAACWPLLIGLASASAMADAVTLEELATPTGSPVSGVSNIAANGTVVGSTWPAGQVARWRPGAEPENLGGDTFTLENILPLISGDGTTIAAASYFYSDDPEAPPIAAPAIWQGGTIWTAVSGLTLRETTPYGISDNGRFLVGAAVPVVPPADGPWPKLAWIWSSAMGQQQLDTPNTSFDAQAWAVSDDGTIAAGFGNAGPGTRLRFGVRWVGTTANFITDSASARVGQAISCNQDCSIIVGAGFDPLSGAGSPQAWRWTQAGGVQYLGTVAGAIDATYYAFDLSEDGSLIVGSYSLIDPQRGPVTRGFIWSEQGGIREMSAFLATHGIDYGSGFGSLIVNSMTPDGRKLLINGQDENYARRRAIVHIDTDSIFSNGFDP
jgi:uncharacterized membrane protein